MSDELQLKTNALRLTTYNLRLKKGTHSLTMSALFNWQISIDTCQLNVPFTFAPLNESFYSFKSF